MGLFNETKNTCPSCGRKLPVIENLIFDRVPAKQLRGLHIHVEFDCECGETLDIDKHYEDINL